MADKNKPKLVRGFMRRAVFIALCVVAPLQMLDLAGRDEDKEK